MEYTLLIGVLAAAIIGMQTYAKRAIQAAVKVSADQLGSQERGLQDIDLRFERKFKGDTLTRTVSDSRRSTATAIGGAVTNETETNNRSAGSINFGGSTQQ